MARLTVVYWRDIPAQVIAAQDRRVQAKRPLSERFELAIDQAAMRGKARSSEEYLADWHKVDAGTCGDSLEAEAEQKAVALEREYDEERLARLVANAGRES